MKTIYNNIIPFKGFSAINLCGIVFARKEYKPLSERTINHEKIHTAQMKALWYLPFLLWYVFEWVIKLFIYSKNSYYNISFEREAYNNELKFDYVEKRKKFAFLSYL